MLTKYLKAALLFVMASAASAQTIIYMDYTSGFTTTLPAPITNSEIDTMVYNTNHPGSYRFGVDWNFDATDQYTITVPRAVTVTAENDVAFCTPTTASNNQITFTETSVHQCNYTATWTTPFNGILTVTYNGEPSTGGPRSDAISTVFTNAVVVGDPQFVGLRGQSYQVHGIDGAVYNLITDDNLQVNSRFVFLTEGECPIMNGQPEVNCWSHAGSYMGEMSFQQVVDGKLHAVLVSAGPAKDGFSMVQVNGQVVKVGQQVHFGALSIEIISSHRVLINTEQFEFELTNSDMFINQALRSKVALSKLHSHGLLGQTHSSKTYTTSLRHIQGEVDDYVIADNDIFGNDFMYNRFTA